MTSLCRFAGKTAISGALLLLPMLALAQNKDGSLELGATASFIKYDRETELDEKIGYSLVMGYNFTKKHGAEFIFTSATATPNTGVSFPVDTQILRLGYMYNAYPREKFVSFFRFGLGMLSIDPDEDPDAPQLLKESDDNFMVYTGGGLRYFFTPRLALRLAGSLDFIDAGNGLANAHVQATGDLGVVFLLGGREPAEKPPEEVKPAEEKKPEEEEKPEEPPAEEKPPEEKPPGL